MISYLSKPRQPGVIPLSQPIELIAQVAAEKQNKYDNVLSSVLTQYSNILNLDTSANKAKTEEYNTLMEQASKELESVLKLDLMNPDNISKVENVFNPILNNTGIMDAVAESKRIKVQSSIAQDWMKKGSDKYSPENYNAFLEDVQYNRNLSSEDFDNRKLQPKIVEYVDEWKALSEQALKLPTVKDVFEDVEGKWIITVDGEKRAFSTILNSLHIDSKLAAQMEINSRKALAGYTPQQLVLEMRGNTVKDIKSHEQVMTSIEEDIKLTQSRLSSFQKDSDNRSLTPQEVSQYGELYPTMQITEDWKVGDLKSLFKVQIQSLENQNKANQDSLTYLTNYLTKLDEGYQVVEKAPNQFEVQAPFDILSDRSLRTQVYSNQTKERVAQAFQINNKIIKKEVNPYEQSTQDFIESQILNEQKNQFDLAIKQLETQANGIGKTSGSGGSKTKEGAVLMETAGVLTEQTNMSTEYLNTELKAAEQEKQTAVNDLAKLIFRNQTGKLNMTPGEAEDYEKIAYREIKLFADGMSQIMEGDRNKKPVETVTIGGTKMKLSEFQEKYQDVINYYDVDFNNTGYYNTVTTLNSNLSNLAFQEKNAYSDFINTGKLRIQVSDGLRNKANPEITLPSFALEKIKKGESLTKEEIKTIYKDQLSNLASLSVLGMYAQKPEDLITLEDFTNQLPKTIEKIKSPVIDNILSSLSTTSMNTAYVVPSNSDFYNHLRDYVSSGEKDEAGNMLPPDAKISGIRFLPTKGKYKTIIYYGAGEKNEPAEQVFIIPPGTIKTLEADKQFKLIEQYHSADKILEILTIEAVARTTNDKYPLYASNQQPESTISVGGRLYNVVADTPGSFTLSDHSAPAGTKDKIMSNLTRAELIQMLFRRAYGTEIPEYQQQLNTLFNTSMTREAELRRMYQQYR